MIYDAIIIGGGASGLLAAVTLAKKGRRVALLEKQSRVGRKLLSTGNGRCNLTNRRACPGDYHGCRRAAETALKRWPPERVEAIFQEMGIPCVADEAGRVYPMSRQAASLLDALRLGCDECGVETLTEFEVVSLDCRDHSFEARAGDGRRVQGRCALICTGGLAAPKLGGSGTGYELFKRFGHALTPRFPALAPLVTDAKAVQGLKGIRAEATLSLTCAGALIRREAGEILFSEGGISGIVAMNMARAVNDSLRLKRGCMLEIDLLQVPVDLQDRAEHLPRREMSDFLNGIVPKRLGTMLVKRAGINMNTPAGELSESDFRALEGLLSAWKIPVTGTLGFDQAQVTAGGVSLNDFDLDQMKSLKISGLFAAGEVLDVDGDCGGFNLQWAWSSALMAAEGIEKELGGFQSD